MDQFKGRRSLEKTGLKTTKTLTRWYRRGIIPEPVIRTHPSGRGKIAYWPDWVLDRCMKIVELQKEGHSLYSAVSLLELERVQETIEIVDETSSDTEVLEGKKVKLKSGREVSLSTIFSSVILNDIKPLVSDRDVLDALISKIKEQNVVSLAFHHINTGHNPVLMFDGDNLDLIPDFLVGHRLSHEASRGSSYLVVPLLASIRKAFSMLGKELPVPNMAFPAPKIWAKQGDVIVEYSIYLGGPVGYELIRETAKTIGELPYEPDKDDGA